VRIDGAFECIEPFDEQPLGNARGPGLPRRETARRKRIVEERDFRDAQGLAYVDPAPARDMESSDAAARRSARLWIA